MATFIIFKNKKPHNKMCRIAIEKAEELAAEINTDPWHPTKDIRGFKVQLSNIVEAQRMKQAPNVAAGQVDIITYNTMSSGNAAIGIRKPGDSTMNIATIILEPDKTTERYG